MMNPLNQYDLTLRIMRIPVSLISGIIGNHAAFTAWMMPLAQWWEVDGKSYYTMAAWLDRDDPPLLVPAYLPPDTFGVDAETGLPLLQPIPTGREIPARQLVDGSVAWCGYYGNRWMAAMGTEDLDGVTEVATAEFAALLPVEEEEE